MSRPYYQQLDISNTKRLRAIISEMPDYVATFFRGIEQTTSSGTRLAYAYDLRVFFNYLCTRVDSFKGRAITDIQLDELEKITPVQFEMYMEYLKYYANEKADTDHVNQERGIARKISCLKSFYSYLYKRGYIGSNPVSVIDMPKAHEKSIICLDADEIGKLLDVVEDGSTLNERQQMYHKITKLRDLAIMMLLLGTGIRVSECVGLDMTDVDFRTDGIKVHRKGGKEVVVYFVDEVEASLRDYLKERREISPKNGHENALFLSLHRKRISVRSVETLVTKYASTVTGVKHITPHKLRSTYGTSLYRETGDIYLVADILGHADVNTTRKHYAAQEDDRRRAARNKVKLRRTTKHL